MGTKKNQGVIHIRPWSRSYKISLMEHIKYNKVLTNFVFDNNKKTQDHIDPGQKNIYGKIMDK